MFYIEIEPESEDMCANLQDSDLSWVEVELIWKKLQISGFNI